MPRLLPSLVAATFLSMSTAAGMALCPAIAHSITTDLDDVYLIHGGDELNIMVYGEKDLTQVVTVLPGGTISYPLVGEIHVGGLTPPEAASTLASSLKKYVRAPQVSVVVAKEGPLEVLVLGDVVKPGKYELPSRSKLTDAIASAGGLGPTDGNFPNARIADAHGAVKLISLQKLLHDGDESADARMGDEMTVYVESPLTLQVHVLGAVDHPGDVVVHAGDRLSMAVARAGDGANSNSDLNHIVLRRVVDGQTQTTNVNLYEVLKSGDISRDPVMLKDDLVYVPSAGNRSDKVSGPAALLYSLTHLFVP